MKLGLALASSSAATIIREPFLVAISKGVCPSCKGKNEYLFHVVVSGDIVLQMEEIFSSH